MIARPVKTGRFAYAVGAAESGCGRKLQAALAATTLFRPPDLAA